MRIILEKVILQITLHLLQGYMKMSDITNEEKPIGLTELIQQVKRELLTPNESAEARIFFVDNVELTIKVGVKRGVKGGIDLSVLSFGKVKLEGGVDREDVHTVKVKLSPLFDKKRLLEFYQTLDPEQMNSTVKKSVEAILKGQSNNDIDNEIL